MKAILVADEDNSIRNIVRLLFTEDRGYRVVAAKSGKEAILKAKKLKPDIVLVDAFLSDKDGYEVSREIKKDPFLKITSVFLLKSPFESFNQEKTQEAFVDGFILKPFSTEVVGTIESLVSEHEKILIGFDSFFQTELIYVKNYIFKLSKLCKKLAEKKRSDVFGQFGAITQVIDERLKNSCLMASGFMRNFKMAVRTLAKARSPIQKLSTAYFRISEIIKISREKFIDDCLAFFKKLEEEKSKLPSITVSELKNRYPGAGGLAQSLSLKIQGLKKIKTVPSISITSYLQVSAGGNSVKNYITGFKTPYRKFMGQDDITKSFELINQSFTNNLKYCHHLVTGFTKKFKLATGKLKDIEVESPILMASSVKDTLLFLYGRRSVIILVDLMLVLSIISLIVFYTSAKENARSLFGISKPVTGFSQFESKPNLGVSLIDRKSLNEAFGETKAESVQLVSEVINEDMEPSSRGKKSKTTKRRMKTSHRKTELSKRDLEEVLRGAFLIQ